MAYDDLVKRLGTQQAADLALVDAATRWTFPTHLVYFIEDDSFFHFSYKSFSWEYINDCEYRCSESVRPFLSEWFIYASAITLNRIFKLVKERHRSAEFNDSSLIFDNGVLIWKSLFPRFVPRELYETDPDNYPPPRSFSRIHCKYLEDPLPTPFYDRIKQIYPATVDSIERHAHNAIFNITKDEQFLQVIGTRNTGKTTIFQIFERALCDIAVSTTIQSLSAESYGRYKCYRKRVLLKNDHPESSLDATAAEFFKNMVEPGVLELRKIYCAPFDWRHNGFCGIITTNKPPYVPDSFDMQSWFRRWEIMEMNVPQPKDPVFKEKVMGEIDSIISRVVQRPHEDYWATHDIETEIKERQKTYLYWRHPVRFAIDACFEITRSDSDKLSIYEIDETVTSYLVDHGFTVPKQKTLHEQITEFLSEKKLRKKLINDFNGNRCNHFFGIRYHATELQKQHEQQQIMQELANEDRRMASNDRDTTILTWSALNARDDE